MAGEVDPVTEDMLIGQTAELEKFQWFIRAHLENAGGNLPTADDVSEKGAAPRRDHLITHTKHTGRPSPLGVGPFCGEATGKNNENDDDEHRPSP